jgi:hypothetical protein
LAYELIPIAPAAVTVDNFAFGISTIPEFFEPILAQQPPVPSDPPIVLDGVEYPVVTSQPILHSNKWNDNRSTVADYNVNLDNLGYGETLSLGPVLPAAK